MVDYIDALNSPAIRTNPIHGLRIIQGNWKAGLLRGSRNPVSSVNTLRIHFVSWTIAHKFYTAVYICPQKTEFYWIWAPVSYGFIHCCINMSPCLVERDNKTQVLRCVNVQVMRRKLRHEFTPLSPWHLTEALLPVAKINIAKAPYISVAIQHSLTVRWSWQWSYVTNIWLLSIIVNLSIAYFWTTYVARRWSTSTGSWSPSCRSCSRELARLFPTSPGGKYSYMIGKHLWSLRPASCSTYFYAGLNPEMPWNENRRSLVRLFFTAHTAHTAHLADFLTHACIDL